jgi:hypothetical protein
MVSERGVKGAHRPSLNDFLDGWGGGALPFPRTIGQKVILLVTEKNGRKNFSVSLRALHHLAGGAFVLTPTDLWHR